MDNTHRLVAIVGVGAILPDAPNARQFWQNVLDRRYSIIETPPDRWDVSAYYDPDPAAPDKTYTKIGGWVRSFEFDWRTYHIPPKVAAAMDASQQWAVTTTDEALKDYGYPKRPLDTERTAVILGTVMGGEMHYVTHLRISFPEYARALAGSAEFARLSEQSRCKILNEWQAVVDRSFPQITEDSMPGELPNIVAGRVANIFNLRGPSFITDAACASSFAGVEAGVELLSQGKVDAVITGGIDHNMGVSSFVKFCKIGALSATGSRPFGDGADGFVMGEGAAVFLLKRLEDAERDGDKIYAVIRGVGGASDGKGKGITAPNPIGQQLAVRRAWQSAGLDPATAGLIEAHGTSTRVGDVVEVESLMDVFGHAPCGSIGLGSTKSNIGHLKAGAGAAGLLKAVFALHDKVLPPTLNAEIPNPGIPFRQTPFSLLHTARQWETANGAPRRAGVSAYGFGGTNFHIVLEEHIPGTLSGDKPLYQGTSLPIKPRLDEKGNKADKLVPITPMRGILALGADTVTNLSETVKTALDRVQIGWTPPHELPSVDVLRKPERLVIDFGTSQELEERLTKAQKVLNSESPQVWAALQSQGIFRGRGLAPGKVAFLFPGQGSQYLNMGRELLARSSQVAEVFNQADVVMEPVLGKPLSQFILVDALDEPDQKKSELALTQTAVCQPAMLTLDTALFRLLEQYGFHPDMVMGHSLGEYAALIASQAMPFEEAVVAVAARGREMSVLEMEDNGGMAAVMAPLQVVQDTLKEIGDYVVTANINSYNQSVIGGSSRAVEQAIARFTELGFQAVRLPVSHAFHTQIVAAASDPLRKVLDRLHISTPRLPLVANYTGDFYPPDVQAIKDILQKQVAAPVQWVKGLETLYASGARIFVEVGPKKALKGFVDDVLGTKQDVISLFTNHPKVGELASFNQALCGLFAAGLGVPEESVKVEAEAAPVEEPSSPPINAAYPIRVFSLPQPEVVPQPFDLSSIQNSFDPLDRNSPPVGSVVISGVGLGLPGAEKQVMDPDNALRILRGEQFVDLIPERFRKRMISKNIVRLVKGEDGNGRFDALSASDEAIKLAGRPGRFDLAEEYGVPLKLVESLDITTQLAMAAGLDALREAGLPLVQNYRNTTTGKYLPDRWLLPESLRDETGVIFASAFPGSDRLVDEFDRYFRWQNRLDQIHMLEDLRNDIEDWPALHKIESHLSQLRAEIEAEPYEFDRRFLFRVLSMGHSQFAEYIGARGPNTQVNAACASTPLAIALAEDWIRSGRCRRVVVISADDVTSDHLIEWVGAGFLAVGAAATDDRVEEAALPFDRRRHGTLMGMGAAALVVESQDAVQERGMRAIVELLSSEPANSAYHGTRLDVVHIAEVMDRLVSAAERRFGLQRQIFASETVFMSHETYTPARGGSASAEVVALQKTFGPAASEIVVANTKGFTGHPMGVGIEDVIAVKILEYGLLPPVPNLKEIDPEFTALKFSRGGRYPVRFALHLAAGFGSQVAMTFYSRIPGKPDRVDNRLRYARWLEEVSGLERAEIEVVKRVLRIKANGHPGRAPAPSNWKYGLGPQVRAAYSLVSFPSQDYKGPGLISQPEVRKGSSDEDSNKPADARVLGGDRRIGSAVANVTPFQPQTVASSVAPIPESVQKVLLSPTVDPVAEKILEIVAAKTGYPPDMLELDLDLEADLGIDTVKQAETFLAIRESFDIPRQDDLRLRDYPTLASVIQFVYQVKPELRSDAGKSGGLEPTITHESPAGAPIDLPIEIDPVANRILSIVSDKTGYPPDMLELDLDLEADLGIDTVKQAETFLAIREAFDIPRQDDLRLRDYPTLGSVIQFVYQVKPELRAEGEDRIREDSTVAPVLTVESTPGPSPFSPDFPRRVPIPVLRPPLELCKPTGVDLNAGNCVVVALDRAGVGEELAKKLAERGVSLLTLNSDLTGAALIREVENWAASKLIQGVYWLRGLDPEPALIEMELPGWKSQTQARIKDLANLLRYFYTSFETPGRFLLTATFMGGLHGYEPQGQPAALAGGLTGFTKAFKRERMSALVKAVDFNPAESAPQIASALLEETLLDPGPVEIGRFASQRFTIGLDEQPLPESAAPLLKLDSESVFLVTGAAGSVTSAVIADLAQASGGIFYLLDLAPAPDPDSEDIRLIRRGRQTLKGKLIDTARKNGERLTPAQIEKQILAVERQEAALRAIETVEAAGGQAFYFSVDLCNASSVQAAVSNALERFGRIDVLIHAAGLEISRLLRDKNVDQFDLVFDVKVDGIFNVLKALGNSPLRALLVFSSIAGRFGNSGQTDYAAANDLLCKMALSYARNNTGARGLAFDWTAWSGIGMATRGSIPKIMEAAGIDMLPPEVGVPVVRRELIDGPGGELVVAGKLGMLLTDWDETGGLDVRAVGKHLHKSHLAVLQGAYAKAIRLHGGLEIETNLDPYSQPFLRDHAIDGTPLLPGVMGMEVFAETAQILAPEWKVSGLENVHFEAPFKFYHMDPGTLYVQSRVHPSGQRQLRAELFLRSRRKLAVHNDEVPGEQEKLHFTANVLLAPEVQLPYTSDFTLPELNWTTYSSEQIYRIYFHGPSFQVIEKAQVGEEFVIAHLARDLPPDLCTDGKELAAPRLVELCFQAAGLWLLHMQKTMALPASLGALNVYAGEAEIADKDVFAFVRTSDGGESFQAQVLDEIGNVYLTLDDYRTVRLPGTLELA